MSDSDTDKLTTMTDTATKAQRKVKDNAPSGGNFLANLVFNIIIPVFVLSRLSGDDSLGPSLSIVFALAFPIGYGLWDLRQSGKVNPLSILGVVSVFLTGGISLLVVERGPGVITKQMDCMGVWSSGTTYITFEDVKVPVENLIGEEGEGFKYSACLRYGYRGPFARADASAISILPPQLARV